MTDPSSTLHTVLCGVCSREKSAHIGHVPARERYLGPHVRQVLTLAERQKREAFVLSGKYGFIPLSAKIAYYDLLLTPGDVRALSDRVIEQLITQQIGRVHFYTKDSDGWLPYIQTMQIACAHAHVSLETHYLSKDE